MNEFYEERKAEIKEAIDVVFRFQLYRRGKIDSYDDIMKVKDSINYDNYSYVVGYPKK